MPAPHEVSPATLRRVIAASAIGNFVEWFDFAVYGFLATLIASQFFASEDASVALLKTFAVFAVAFALRPLGGIVFGALGDRLGRKRILSLTILLMAGSTTLIGLLPTYASIGLAAPALLTLARCLQGFSAGGEYAGACAYLMEHAPNDKRAFYGSFVPVSTFSAFACAAVIAYGLEASLSAEAMNAFTCLWVMLCVFPAYWLASSGSMPGALLGVILLAVGALCSGVVTAALLSESFPTRTRYTASAITYNVAYTLFGGTAPLVATWLIGQTGSSLAPAFYLVVIALVALVGGLALPETSRISLHDEAGGDGARTGARRTV